MIVVGLLLRFSNLSRFFFLRLQPLHNLFCLFILIDHNVTDAKVCDHNGGQAEHVIGILIDYRLVVSDCFVVAFQDKEDVGNVQLPGLVVCTKLSTLSEELFNN